MSATCDKCEGRGFIPTRGYRFHSLNATYCPCGAYPSLTEACNAADARRSEELAAAGATLKDERRAARVARAEARRQAAR